MPLTRRRMLALTTAFAAAAGCARPAAPAPPPASAPPGPPDTPDALVDWIAARPDRASLLVDDGRGTLVEHLADRPRPVASANKVVHLVAYAQAVAAGRLDPDGPVPVAAWEAWYVPSGAATDTHPAAAQALGAVPDGVVTWDGIAAVMIDLSDNAAADLLRAELGDDALVAAAAATGWSPVELPCFAGEVLAFDAVPPGTDRPTAVLDAGRAYAGDPARRAAHAAAVRQAGATPTDDPTAGLDDPTLRAVLRWWDGSPAAAARQLAGVHRAAATDALGPEVSATVRRHLERALTGRLPAGVLGAGQKGGNYAGLITNAFTLRRADGTTGLSVLSLSGLDRAPYQELVASSAWLGLTQQVLLDPGLRDRLRAAVGGS
ncbi:serine hydrolase [Pseudonocardia lacus]|uniref:serine hydrolase n=1 Tax=Pseudonocardia lacus TaxID=2835865 RepID=UPI001BDC116A|nr:serine hydrolase [Pseudonocardia lacus]